MRYALLALALVALGPSVARAQLCCGHHARAVALAYGQPAAVSYAVPYTVAAPAVTYAPQYAPTYAQPVQITSLHYAQPVAYAPSYAPSYMPPTAPQTTAAAAGPDCCQRLEKAVADLRAVVAEHTAALAAHETALRLLGPRVNAIENKGGPSLPVPK
jgi:hypothetical protein